MVRAQFYIISVVVAVIYLIGIASLLIPPAVQPYDQVPPLCDNIRHEVEFLMENSNDPWNDLEQFDIFLEQQLAELNYEHDLSHDSSLTSFTLTLSSGRTEIVNTFEVKK